MLRNLKTCSESFEQLIGSAYTPYFHLVIVFIGQFSLYVATSFYKATPLVLSSSPVSLISAGNNWLLIELQIIGITLAVYTMFQFIVDIRDYLSFETKVLELKAILASEYGKDWIIRLTMIITLGKSGFLLLSSMFRSRPLVCAYVAYLTDYMAVVGITSLIAADLIFSIEDQITYRAKLFRTGLLFVINISFMLTQLCAFFADFSETSNINSDISDIVSPVCIFCLLLFLILMSFKILLRAWREGEITNISCKEWIFFSTFLGYIVYISIRFNVLKSTELRSSTLQTFESFSIALIVFACFALCIPAEIARRQLNKDQVFRSAYLSLKLYICLKSY